MEHKMSACRVCREPGHNRQNCPSRSEKDREADRAKRKRKPATDLINAILSEKGNVKAIAVKLGVSRQAVDQQLSAKGLVTTARDLRDLTKPTPWEKKQKHRAACSKQTRERSAKRRKSGLCVCGAAPETNRRRCATCAEKGRLAAKKTSDARMLLGKCRRCARAPKPGCTHCAKCLVYMGKVNARSKQRRKEAVHV